MDTLYSLNPADQNPSFSDTLLECHICGQVSGHAKDFAECYCSRCGLFLQDLIQYLEVAVGREPKSAKPIKLAVPTKTELVIIAATRLGGRLELSVEHV